MGRAGYTEVLDGVVSGLKPYCQLCVSVHCGGSNDPGV